MEGYKVIITTSGVGSRLGEITSENNKSLIKIGDKPVLSYIIESYPNNCEFIITLGHYGDYVKQFLQVAYPELKFKFVWVDNFSGETSSLAYSISKCKAHLNSPFIYHACDTIIDDYIPTFPKTNYVLGSKKGYSYYSTIDVRNNKLYKINKSGEKSLEFDYVGICGVKNYELFTSCLEKLITSNQFNLSDVDIIRLMMKNDFFDFIEVDNELWFDTGNIDELNKTKIKFVENFDILDKKKESIYFIGNHVIKFFSDSTICKNRVNRTKYLKNVVPEIDEYSKNFYKYKLIDGIVLSEVITPKKFEQLLIWLTTNLWFDIDKKNKTNFIDFYYKKTLDRINEVISKEDSEEIINGMLIPPIHEIIKMIDFHQIGYGIKSKFHGDLILDNIIYNDGSFILIDWRQDFLGNLETGDIYYDLAKLNHNLILNHEILKKNLYEYDKLSDNRINVLIPSTLLECQDILHKFIIDMGLDLKKVKIITSLIWLNMSPLHEYPLNMFLFKFGKYKLYKEIV